MTHMWPIHFSSLPLSAPDKKSAFPPDLGDALAQLAEAKFDEYLTSILPLELKSDETFAKTFHEADHSRVNLAFQRWQKLAFAEIENVPVYRFLGQGEYASRIHGVNYSWPELYESPAFKKLKHFIMDLTRHYNKKNGFAPESPAGGKHFQVILWAEVFRKGDAMRPGASVNGAFLRGRYYAMCERGAIKQNFEDPRGINPPYGKTYSHSPYRGNLVLYPTWASHFITPNMLNTTIVSFSFMAFPLDGAYVDSNDDQTGKIVVEKQIMIEPMPTRS